MQRLKKIRSSLRRSNNIDSAAEVTEVKDVIKSHLDSLVEIQKHRQDGKEEMAGFALKSMVGQTDSLVEMSQFLREEKEDDSLSSFDGNSLSLDDIPNDELMQFIPSGIFDELVERTQGKTFVSLLLCDLFFYSSKTKDPNLLLEP